jgi:hypothetical protein
MSTEVFDELYDPQLILLKQRELEILRQKLALVRENGLEFYRPSEKQHEFHISQCKERGLFAGNRFGKSEASAAETIAWFVGERTWYKHSFPIYGVRVDSSGRRVKTLVGFHEGHENHPYVTAGIPRHSTKQLIITTDWKKVSEVWTGMDGDNPGKVWKYIPKRINCKTRSNQTVIDQIIGDNGSIIRFTTEQAFIKNPQSAESTDYDRIGIDEPILEDMFKASARGLIDRNGQVDFTLTSLRERWIYDRFTGEDLQDKPIEVRTRIMSNRFSVRATMGDNPYLTDESMQRYLDNLTDDEKSCREAGLPLELAGLVYKHFQREKHVLKTLPVGWEDWTKPPPDWTIYVSIDVHDKLPQAVLFVAVPPVGSPIIYDEIWRDCVAYELAEEIKLRVFGRTVGCYKCDPLAWREDPVNRVSMAQALQAAGVPVEQSSKAKSFGILNMNGLFKQRLKDALGNERMAVYVTPNCHRFLWEIGRYHYEDNVPVDRDDHFMECMYRLFIAPLAWISPISSSPVADFDIPMTRRVLDEFNVDAKMFDRAVGINN